MGLQVVDWFVNRPTVLPYSGGKVPAGFPSPAEDYLETPPDVTEHLIKKAGSLMMRVMATP